jgi:SNF2 family DNA or RNA helicase
MLERFEWLEIPAETQAPKKRRSTADDVVLGKRCPACGWLDEETALECFRCGHRYNRQTQLVSAIEALGVQLPPRLIEGHKELARFLRQQEPASLDLFHLRVRAETLRLSRGFDELICLEDIAVDHYDHQLDTARRALRDMRGRALLADEVGLGKTIEAGIIMKELIERGLAQTILVLTPASLTEQWREELENKFREPFTILDAAADWRGVAGATAGRWIVSLDTAKQTNRAAVLLERDYDLLIVDEAHKLKNRSTVAWRFVNQIRKRYVLMLTATPVQNDLTELYSLVTILSPGHLGTVRGFRRQYFDQRDGRQPRNAPALRRLLNDVMIRNQRSKVTVRLPPRRAAVYHLNLSEPELELYRQVTQYIREEFQQEAGSKHLRLVLLTLQRELCSSPQAVVGTLEKLVSDAQYPEATRRRLTAFLALAQTIGESRKLNAVREILDRFPGKFLIFTEYRHTLEQIVSQLRAWNIAAAPFHGGMNVFQKEDAVRAFEKETRVLVSTESGAEGRNLQFCHQLINYDLPWNPMRVEQRIGRLHRLGQKHEVSIFNLSSNETVESHILDLLAYKIRMFELVIGELDLILGTLDAHKSFEDLVREAWQGSRSEDDLAARMGAIGSAIERARREFTAIRESSDLLNTWLEN